MSIDYSYISVELKPEFTAELYNDLISIGVRPGDKHALHSTIMFDERKDLEQGFCDLDPSREFVAFVTKVEPLGEHDLVFHLTSREMVDEFFRLKDAGYRHSFKDPLPHMTVVYDFDKYDKLLIEQHMGHWLGKRLVFTNESFGQKKDRSI